MKNDKQLKKEFKKEVSKNPEKYFAVSELKKYGFKRAKCKDCGTYYWSTEKRGTCGDAACSGGYKFIGDTPAKNKLGYIEVWKEFSKLFKKLGYTPIKKYPVAARWRDDTDFVQASIYNFQPYVVSGEVKPPANPLVVPQFSLRFNDIDNVGITGAHYTGFVMIGQHAFVTPDRWDQEKYFKDIKMWLNKGLGIEDKEIIFHEDAWAGGGNFGPCMEFFSRGMELGNQVYMMYEQTPEGTQELKLKVLDMGMGHERNAWFTQGTATSYETTFPTVMKELFKKTGLKVDQELMKIFLPYAAYLNIDEIANPEKEWKRIAKEIGVKDLKEKILPLSALYSVAEHTRTLLVALADGVLPSNVGGGYNLRVILRRILSFIDKYKWDIDLREIAEIHAEYLLPLFPELKIKIKNVKRILEVEKEKYEATKEKTKRTIKQIIQQEITPEKLISLYDSQGIQPEMIKSEAKKLGKEINIPEDFYAKVAERHEKVVQKNATIKENKLNIGDLKSTEALYYSDYKKIKFGAKILKIIDDKIILDRTYFYPTSGGQLHDIGYINSEEIIEVYKQRNVILHVLKDPKKTKLHEGEEIIAEINWERRKQLTQHHTTTHIINSATKKVLGDHIFQAGAKKTVEKAHLDVTHYENITEKQIKSIEKEANNIVKQKIRIKSSFLDRDIAERKYGLDIYQGGAVPGNNLRIINVEGVDVEACGGTHLHDTSEIGEIKILKTTKIQDGIVRIIFTAGKSAKKTSEGTKNTLQEIKKVLEVKEKQIPAAAEQLFKNWKKAKKAKKKNKVYEPIKETLKYFEGDIISETAKILKTQPEHIIKTLNRFKKEIKPPRS